MTPARVLLRRTLAPLVLLSAVAGVVVGAISTRQPAAVDVAMSLTVPLPETAAGSPGIAGPPDGSDAVAATELFVGTVTAWLSSPDVVAAVYQRAGLPSPQTSLRRLARSFTAVARGGQVVDVRFRVRSADEGTKLAAALTAEVRERANALSRRSGAFRFAVEAGSPLQRIVQRNSLLRGAVGALVVLVVGINLVLLWDFLRAGSV